MLDLYGKEIGTTIDFRSQGSYEAQHQWPAETTVSAGRGVVFVRNAKEGEPTSYGTLFMEVYPPGAAFIRGEGESPESCENAAWAIYQVAINCSDGSGTHDWKARNYHNGAGFCSRCSTFGAKIFTGEQLGQLCKICGIGTTHHWDKDANGEPEFLCEEHYEQHKPAKRTPSETTLGKLLDSLIDEDLCPTDSPNPSEPLKEV